MTRQRISYFTLAEFLHIDFYIPISYLKLLLHLSISKFYVLFNYDFLAYWPERLY